MKLRSVAIFGWIILLLIGISACEEEEDPVVEDVVVELSELTDGEVKAVIDDSVYVADDVTAEVTDENFTMVIEFPEDRTLTIVTDTLAQQEFDMGPGPAEMTFMKGSDIYTSTGGKLKFISVNTVDQTVSGTFNVFLHEGGREIAISSAAFKSIPFTIDSAPEPENGFFTATINGESWSAETMTAQVNSQVNILDIRGTTESDEDISIYFDAEIEAGKTYPLTANGDYVAVVYEPGQTVATHYSSSGELTITEHNMNTGVIAGEFYFQANSQSSEVVYEVTGGEFRFEGY